MNRNNVKISSELFAEIIKWFLLGQKTREAEEEIRKALAMKIREMNRRDLYHRYKTTPPGTEREELRRKYLDKAGVKEDCRW